MQGVSSRSRMFVKHSGRRKGILAGHPIYGNKRGELQLS